MDIRRIRVTVQPEKGKTLGVKNSIPIPKNIANIESTASIVLVTI
jgi:hypothetical protein